MTIIKCKMCGGDLTITPGSTICECEYCGSKQTIPNTDDEKRLKLYERANKLRYECEFDKASGVYESIVAEYQSEAEAYWGLVLCKYGIEYVDDPKTGKKIPTCHRSSFDSIFDDSDFDRVMENADTVARALYREEAKQIEELRKGIIEVSSKEDAYDIFICYKETADDGERTIDSVIAQDVYEALNDKGYRVFFSRITLEDKLGQEYEPYIFAALNSAKVMLAFGTTYDYYNAVWVKNEWSRFLQLMESGQKKTLIPCYKDIDAYDMPKEFARLQAQDMGKVGAIQDLLRGIDKIFGRDKKPGETTAILRSAGDSNATVKRGYFALEDGEWEKAIQYFDQAMDLDPENAEIHLGLFLAKRNFTDLDSYLDAQLKNLSSIQKNSLLACKPKDDVIEKIAEENVVPGYYEKKDITDQFLYKLTYTSSVDGLNKEKEVYEDKDWKKVERLAKGELLSQVTSIKTRHLEAIDQQIETESQKDTNNAEKITKEYDSFIEETRNRVIEARYQAEARREQDYSDVLQRSANVSTEQECNAIISQIERIGEYKDSRELLATTKTRLNDIRNEQQRLQAEKKAQTMKLVKKISIVAAIVVVLIIAGVVGFNLYKTKVLIPNQKYDEACKLMDDQKYEEAISAFTELDGYKDSSRKIDECNTAIADAEAAEEAQKQAEKLAEKQKEQDELYQSIIDKIDSDDYDGAIEELESIDDEENKKQVIDYFVEAILDDYNDSRVFNFYYILKKTHDSCIELLELVDDEQKDALIKANDDRCIAVGLSRISSADSDTYEQNSVEMYLDLIINQEKYEEDIETTKKIINTYKSLASKCDKLNDIEDAKDWETLKKGYYLYVMNISYEASTHRFRLSYSKKYSYRAGKNDWPEQIIDQIDDFYILSSGLESMTFVKENQNILSIDKDLNVNTVESYSGQEALTVFDE